MKIFQASLPSNIGQVQPPQDIYGCTDPLSTNYNPLATIDDGSCLYGDWVLPENSVRVTLYTGQSNAGGNGYNTEALPSEIDETPFVKICATNGTSFNNLNISAWNNQYNVPGGHSIELGISNAYEQKNDYPLYLIKRSVGGTKALEHIPTGRVYNEFYDQYASKGINYLLNQGYRVFVDLVYLQGEGDSNQADYPYFSEKMDIFINTWRGHLGANLPITFINVYEVDNWYVKLNQIFDEKAANDSRIFVIDNTGATTNDGIHYTYATLKTLAERYMVIHDAMIPLEVTSLLPDRAEYVAPATPTLISVGKFVQNSIYYVKLVLDVGAGDNVTSIGNLRYKIYDDPVNPTYLVTQGGENIITNVGSEVTILTPIRRAGTYNFQVIVCDEAGNNSAKSNSISATLN